MPQPAHEKETIAIQSNGATNDIKSLSEDLKTFGLFCYLVKENKCMTIK